MYRQIALACFLTISTAASAQLGVAVVYDPANFAQNVTQAARLLQQIQDHARYMTEFGKHLTKTTELKDLADINLRKNYQSVLGQYTAHFNTLQSQLQQLRGIVRNSPLGAQPTIQMIAQRYTTMYPDARGQLPQVNYNVTAAQLNQWVNFQSEARMTRQVELQQDMLLQSQMALQGTAQTQSQLTAANTGSQNATGALQAMQAGNQINTRVAAELMQLNATIAMQSQLMVEQDAREIAARRNAQAQGIVDRANRRTNTRPGAAGASWWRQ